MIFGVIIWQTVAPGGREATLIFHTYVGSGHFFFGGGVKTVNFNILGAYRKMNTFGVLRFCRYFIWGHHNIGLYSGVNSMHLSVFFKVNGNCFCSC